MKKETILTLFITGIAVAFTGCSNSSEKKIESTSKNKSPESAVPNSFAEVTSKLDTNGDVFVYYSTEDVIATIEKYAKTAGDQAAKSIAAPMEKAMMETAPDSGQHARRKGYFAGAKEQLWGPTRMLPLMQPFLD